MYLEAPQTKPILFGDLLSADWLYDAWLESDACLLGGLVNMKGGYQGYAEHVRQDHHTWLLAHGKKPIAVMLVNDDCYLETITRRHRRGRLLAAPVFGYDTDPDKAAVQQTTTEYGRLPLPEDPLFAGGVAELRYAFGIGIKNQRDVEHVTTARTVALTDIGRLHLETRWGAHAARRGPLIAQRTADKLAELTDGQARSVTAAQAVARLLAATWASEGSIADLIDTAHEAIGRGDTIGLRQLLTDITDETAQLETALTAVNDALTGLANTTT